MSVTGGTPRTLSLDGPSFPVTTASEPEEMLGGYNSEHETDGDGSTAKIMVRAPNGVSNFTIRVDSVRGDRALLTELRNRPGFFPVEITLVDGRVLAGSGSIDGEVNYNFVKSTAQLALRFDGDLQEL